MIRKMQTGPRRLFALLLCPLMLSYPVFAGQQVGLRVTVVAGSGTQNIINEIPPAPFAVRIIDANSRPVPGVEVVFTAPQDGPSGTFPTGATFMTLTDEDGRALGLLYRPNAVEGAYTIQVRASYLGEVAMTSIRQINVLAKKSSKKIFVILALAGAGAAIAATSRGSGGNGSGNPTTPPASTTPTITFGGASIGGQ